MTDLSKWLIELAKQANVKPAPDVDVTMFVMDVFPDLAALCAQQHEALEYYASPQQVHFSNEVARDALAAAKAFKEKYQ